MMTVRMLTVRNTKTPLELYVHIPFCIRKCQYCDFLSGPSDEETKDRYIEALLKEIRAAEHTEDYEIVSVFIGGGTPSALKAEAIASIMRTLQEQFFFCEDAEVTIEANPGTVDLEKLTIYRNVGINRLSLGLQSTDAEELKLLGRIHSYEEFLKSYEWARKAGFSNINIDLMFAIPGQTGEAWRQHLYQVAELNPEHISAYSLIIEEGTPFAEQNLDLPDEDTEYQMYEDTAGILAEYGYQQYEISNYAKDGYACRHNIGYWKRVDYLGVGLGASSLIDNVRYSNTRDLYTYLSECENIHDCYMQYPLTEGVTGSAFSSADGTHILVPAVNLHAAAEQTTRNEQMEEYMFLGLRMRDGFYREEFTQAFGIPIEAVYGDALNHLQQEELLLKREGRIYLTDKGMDLNNYVVAQFML